MTRSYKIFKISESEDFVDFNEFDLNQETETDEVTMTLDEFVNLPIFDRNNVRKVLSCLKIGEDVKIFLKKEEVELICKKDIAKVTYGDIELSFDLHDLINAFEEIDESYSDSNLESVFLFNDFFTNINEKEEVKKIKSNDSVLSQCIDDVEKIVQMFEKDDQKLIDLTLPILDLCQTNLNFLERKVEGQKELYECSKKIIISIVDKLKKEYSSNDIVLELISNCEKI